MRKQTVAPFDSTIHVCRHFYRHDSTTCGGDRDFENKHGHTSKVRCTASRICVEARAQVEYEGKHPDGKHAAVFARSYIPFAER